ncbi:MAG: DUF4184 family protein, partial [Myxococcales bacterium]|nr:DUF4184 family protein [Myxococcales bacterium]
GLWLYEVVIAPALGFEATALQGGPARWALVVVAIVVGASTHVFVDGFTLRSAGRPGPYRYRLSSTALLAASASPLVGFMGGPCALLARRPERPIPARYRHAPARSALHYGWAAIRWPALRERTLVLPTYRWLQYGASAVGSVVLLYAGRRLLPRLLEPRALAAVAAIAMLSVGHGARVAVGFQGVLGVRVFLVRAVAGALVLGAGALVANGVWYRLTVARGPQPR